MKKVILTLVLLFLGIISGYSQFEWQTITSPVSENLRSVFFTDPLNGFIISDAGTIMTTHDAGSTWQVVQFPDYHLESIYFSDDDHGYIVGWELQLADSSLIMKTVDGGDTWQVMNHYRVNRFYDVFFINNDVGWAVGSKADVNLNCIYYSDDGGQNWMEQTGITIVGAELLGVSFRDDQLGSTCGVDGAFFLTSSGGTSWAMDFSFPVLNLNDIYNYGTLTGCIVGDEGTALFTTNNWYQYIDQVSNTEENLNAVSGAPGTNFLWACGDNGTIIYNSTYLLPWAPQVSGTTEVLNDIQMLSPIEGWAVGDNGTILYFNPVSKMDKGYSNTELSVFPNPTTGTINIEFEPMNEEVSIQVFDLQGTSIINFQVITEDQCQLDLSGNASGVYYLAVYSASGYWSQKILLK